MKKNAFRSYLEGRKLSATGIESSVAAVREFEMYLRKRKVTLKSAGVDALRDYISLLIEEDKNSTRATPGRLPNEYEASELRFTPPAP